MKIGRFSQYCCISSSTKIYIPAFEIATKFRVYAVRREYLLEYGPMPVSALFSAQETRMTLRIYTPER